ncbi:MAG: hypothetical protein IT303_20205 [Dehalococcoidia bacterium]|nr:hypothetical protein [Dehalococcoidia bacterium]
MSGLMWGRRGLMAAAALALFLVGCSSSEKDEPTPTPQPTTAVAMTPAATPTRPAATPTTTPTRPSSPTVTPTPTRAAASSTDVIDAAVAALGARHLDRFSRDACMEDNPQGLPCIQLVAGSNSLAGGLALFNGGYPDAGPFTLVMGRNAAGAWQVWYLTQQPSYTLTAVPGEVLACGGGAGVAVHAEPGASSSTVTTVEDLAELTADEFVLTSPGAPPATRGEGWYHVTGAAEGWIPARNAAAAQFGDCLLRDELERGSHG